MYRTSPLRPLAATAAILFCASLPYAAAQDGPLILITPEKGVANSFELVRVYPDKVEVRREGIRLNFSRDSIKSVKNAEATGILEEAQAIIGQVGEESLEELPALLERAERTTPRIEGVVQKFDWLIPEATQALLDMRQTLFALRDTARAAERLEMLNTQLQKMADGTTTLAATWEQVVDQGLEVTDAIPFPEIQKDFQDRFTRIRRNIRLDLSQRRTRSLERIRTIGEELLAQVEAGTLRESRLTLAMNELDRLYEGILDPDAKREIGVFVDEVKEKTSREIEVVKEKEAFAASVQAVRALEEGLQSGAIAPATGERVPELVRAKDLLAALPESPTKEILSVDLSDLEVQVARAMASSVPRPPGGGVEIPLPGPGDLPPGPEDSSFLGTLKRSLGLGAAIVAGVVVLLIVLMILAGRMMQKRKKAKIPEAAPEFTSQYDIFQIEGEEKRFPFSPSPVTSAIPIEPAPPASTEDLFGFEPEPEPELVLAGPAASSGEAPLAQAVPDDPFDLPPEPDEVEDDLFGFAEEEEESSEPDSAVTVATEEDPFQPGDSDPTADLEAISRPAPELSVPTPPEEDIFGLGNLDEEAPETSLPPSPAAPPRPAREPEPLASETMEFDETLDDDPLGLRGSSTPPAPEPTQPSTPPPAPEIPEPSTSSAEDDPFGFNDLLADDDANSAIEDDLFADSDSKD
jgi:hypothetical protein